MHNHKQNTKPETEPENVAKPPAGDTLLLLAHASGIKPATSWYRELGVSQQQLTELAGAQQAAVDYYRRLLVVGGLFTEQHLALILRARLAEQVIAASSAKELAEAVRVLEKLPALSPPADSAEGLAELDTAGLEAAVSEARALLTELDGAAPSATEAR